MNHPCVVSLDEKRQDKQNHKAIYSREELIESDIKDRLKCFEDFPEEILDHMPDENVREMLHGFIGMLMNPRDDDLLEAANKCVEEIEKKHRDFAETKAEEHAEEVGL